MRGGYREGAGRKTLYPGKTVRVTVSLTPEAIDRAREVAAQLQKEHPKFPISVSDAVEAALWEYPPRRRKK